MTRINVPADAIKIINRLEESGYEAYVVGGCVRDSILGRTPYDWDITTSALPLQVKALFDHTVDTGLKHGTVTVLMDKTPYEVTTYRIDGEYEDSRHPLEVTFTTSLEEDLMRRDFTINAMAYHPERGLVDLFGGMEDLSAGIIRCVGDPYLRFSEDALRMMRAVRFGAQLCFEIEEKTRSAIAALAGTLEKISAERIRDELCKLLCSRRPRDLVNLYELGLTKIFLPEFDILMETEQNNPHHMYTVGMHTVEAVCLAPEDLTLRLTMLLHDIGKPRAKTTDEKGVDHFKRHQEIGADMAEDIMKRLRFDNDTIKRVRNFVRYHDERPGTTEKAIRRAIVRIGPEAFPDFFIVQRADLGAQSMYMREEKERALEEFEKTYYRILDEENCIRKSDLALGGRDLIEMGIKPGPGMGEIIDRLFEKVVDDPALNEKETLMKMAEKIAGDLQTDEKN